MWMRVPRDADEAEKKTVLVIIRVVLVRVVPVMVILIMVMLVMVTATGERSIMTTMLTRNPIKTLTAIFLPRISREEKVQKGKKNIKIRGVKIKMEKGQLNP